LPPQMSLKGTHVEWWHLLTHFCSSPPIIVTQPPAESTLKKELPKAARGIVDFGIATLEDQLLDIELGVLAGTAEALKEALGDEWCCNITRTLPSLENPPLPGGCFLLLLVYEHMGSHYRCQTRAESGWTGPISFRASLRLCQSCGWTTKHALEMSDSIRARLG
ncbi:hypothetical protein FOZ63_019868, partial [Perkinsus olseni]